MRHAVCMRLGLNTEGREIRITIVEILLFGALEKPNNLVSERRKKDFHRSLCDPLRQHQTWNQLVRYQATVPKSERIEQERVYPFSKHCRADGSHPKVLALSQQL